MSLQSQVTARYSSEKLRLLTNPDNRGSTTDTTRLGYACTDAEAEFRRRTAVAYDDTDDAHVGVAVELVILILMKRGAGSAAAIEAQQRSLDASFDQLRQVLGRDRPNAVTTGQNLTVTREGANGVTARPKFDRANLEGFVPRSPSGS